MTNANLSQLFAGALPIEIRRSVSKALFALLICLGFLVLGIWGLAAGGNSHDLLPFTLWAAEIMHLSSQGALHFQEGMQWLCVFFFGLGALLLLLIIIFDHRPLILLNHEGVWVRGWKGCPIEWKNIERVWKVEQRPGAWLGAAYGVDGPTIDWVCLALKDPDVFQKKQGKFKQKAMDHYRSRGMGNMYFTPQAGNFEVNEVIAAIQSHIGGANLSPVESLLSSASA